MAEDEKQAKLKVLIIDDSPDIVRRINDIFSSLPDFTLLEPFTSGEKAIEKIRELSPDIAIIDMSLPGIGGLELVRRLRKTDSKTQIVILTMLESRDYETSCLSAGANYFLNKIHDFERLPSVLKSLVGKKN